MDDCGETEGSFTAGRVSMANGAAQALHNANLSHDNDDTKVQRRAGGVVARVATATRMLLDEHSLRRRAACAAETLLAVAEA